MQKYFINDRGIYDTRPIYHDDVEYIYFVEFNKPDSQKQLDNFLKNIFEEGKKARTAEIQHLFSNK